MVGQIINNDAKANYCASTHFTRENCIERRRIVVGVLSTPTVKTKLSLSRERDCNKPKYDILAS